MSGEPDHFWCHNCRDWTVVCDAAVWPDEQYGSDDPPAFWCDDCGEDYHCDECGGDIDREGHCLSWPPLD